MAETMWEKYREEREKNQSKTPKHGKQVNQRLKTYSCLNLTPFLFPSCWFVICFFVFSLSED